MRIGHGGMQGGFHGMYQPAYHEAAEHMSFRGGGGDAMVVDGASSKKRHQCTKQTVQSMFGVGGGRKRRKRGEGGGKVDHNSSMKHDQSKTKTSKLPQL